MGKRKKKKKPGREPGKPVSAACRSCGSRRVERRERRYDPAWTVGLILLGCVLAFYLVGLVIGSVGLWLWSRKRTAEVCPICTPA